MGKSMFEPIATNLTLAQARELLESLRNKFSKLRPVTDEDWKQSYCDNDRIFVVHLFLEHPGDNIDFNSNDEESLTCNDIEAHIFYTFAHYLLPEHRECPNDDLCTAEASWFNFSSTSIIGWLTIQELVDLLL